MSDSEALSADDDADADEPGPLAGAYRTVTPSYLPRPDPEMDAVGWAVFLGVVLLFVPLLPFVAVVWLLSKAIELAVSAVGRE